MNIPEFELYLTGLGAYKLNGNWILTPAAIAILANKIRTL